MDTVFTSLFLGLLASTSPCVLPLYPGFLTYLSGQAETEMGKKRYFLGFFVLAGVMTMMLALGALIALFAVPTGNVLAMLIPLADLLILTLGILLLFDLNLFKKLPHIQIPVFHDPYLNAYMYGLMYGPIALPCSGPLVVSIFAYSFTIYEAVSKLWVFILFGLGFGLPLFILSFLSGSLQRHLTTYFAKHSRIINIIGGILLIGIAIYDMSVNWDMLVQFYFLKK